MARGGGGRSGGGGASRGGSGRASGGRCPAARASPSRASNTLAKARNSGRSGFSSARTVRGMPALKAKPGPNKLASTVRRTASKAVGTARKIGAVVARGAKAAATKLKAAAQKPAAFAKKVVHSPVVQCAYQRALQAAKRYPEYIVKKAASTSVKESIIKPAVAKLVAPTTVKGAATLIKAAGNSIKPVVRQVSPAFAKAIGKATNKGTVNAIGKSLRAFGKTKVASAAYGGVASTVVKIAERAIEHKSLTSKAAVFDYGTTFVKGALAAAITGAIVGSVVPGPGTVVGFVGGLLATIVVGAAVSMVVDAAAKPVEDAARAKLGINEND